MNQIAIVGCGQLGSRHLQAMKAVPGELSIHVSDSSAESLAVGRERYSAMAGTDHPARFATELPRGMDIYVAIIATSSQARRPVMEDLLRNNRVKYIIAEKILFPNPGDYAAVADLIDERGAGAWVNCPMRIMPFYRSLPARIGEGPVLYGVTGSKYGFVTNLIHYIDHLCALTRRTDFWLCVDGIEPRLYESKRQGYSELNGSVSVGFPDGSFGTFSCLAEGNTPVKIDISTGSFRCVSRESEGKAWVSSADGGWSWIEEDAKVPYQSQMTSWLVSELLEKGTCGLTGFRESCDIHTRMLNGIGAFLKREGILAGDMYPFT